MKKSCVMRVLTIAFLVTILTGMPLLAACSSSNSTAPEDEVSEEPKYAVQIFIDCEQNLFFSKYDVDVMVDDEGVGNVEHGSEATFEVNLTKGQHKLVLEEEGRTSPDGKTSFVVEGEGDKFTYKIHCTKDKIEIEPIEDEAEDKTEAQEDDMRVVSYDGASLEVPNTWEVTDAEAGKYAYPEYEGMVYLHASEMDWSESSADEAYDEIMAGFMEGGQYTVSDKTEKGKNGKAVTFENEITLQADDTHYKGKLKLILTGDKMYAVMFVIPDSDYEQHSGDIADVLGSIKLDNPTAPTFSNNSNGKDKESEESEATEQDADAAEKGARSGVFEYCYVMHPTRKTEYSYDLYYLFDEDTHTAIDFQSDGPEDIWVWPYRGTFNNGIELDLIDGDEVVAQWHARWGSKDSPRKLIIVDDDGFETEFEMCSESEALSYFSDAMWEKAGL